MDSRTGHRAKEVASPTRADLHELIYPLRFSSLNPSPAVTMYLRHPPMRRLMEFFEAKGLSALKEEDQREQWYQDWLDYQSGHQIYATVLSPREFSTLGNQFDLLRLARFLEMFAYYSPAHGYSLQVTFLGLFAVLMGRNDALKREAVAAMEAGRLLAFAVSEKDHGADLLANEFTVVETSPGQFKASGTKYYIGNANCASIIAVLARKENARSAGRSRRAPMALFALRPDPPGGFKHLRKIRTLGVHAAYVGEFTIENHVLSGDDLIAEGRDAWDAVFGTITLGKFLLGFGSIGICEHALAEAVEHVSGRLLYGKPVIAMPHIRIAMAQAYARLTGMKLYAYRALDHVHAASAEDRRYLFFNAVQKARVSTEGVKVVALLSECLGARGFESETYFEMALRDVQLIPGLEGSTHVNLGLTTQFLPAYFSQTGAGLPAVQSLIAAHAPPDENPYLMCARSGGIDTVRFNYFLDAYAPLMSIPNVRLFAMQAKAFELLLRERPIATRARTDAHHTMLVGQCLATIAYGQLIAENAVLLGVPVPVVSVMFHLLVSDFSACALALLASFMESDQAERASLRHLIAIPSTDMSDWQFVAARMSP